MYIYIYAILYAIQNGVSYFSCGIFTRATSKVTISQVKTSKVTISQVKTSKVTISQVKTSQIYNFPSGDFPNSRLYYWGATGFYLGPAPQLGWTKVRALRLVQARDRAKIRRTAWEIVFRKVPNISRTYIWPFSL